MKFGIVPVAESVGLIIAHTFRGAGVVLKKGHVITAADVAVLHAAGINDITGARLEAGDLGENEAAAAIARKIAGPNVKPTQAHTGRCNLEAGKDGVIVVDAACINRINGVDESVTVATLRDMDAVKAGQTIATVKIIPFAVSVGTMSKVDAAIGTASIKIYPYQPRKFAVISTVLPGVKDSVIASTEQLTQQRVKSVDGSVIAVERCAHTGAETKAKIDAAVSSGADIILIASASATVDRGDVVPTAICDAGGVIDHFGMPVDPGNLLVLGHIGARKVLVLPGCARSPKLNGFDWVLQRLAAGVAVTRADIMGMGVGGLLVDTPSRPLPRDTAVRVEAEATTPKVGAVILAAGQSRRMGSFNKLLMSIDGRSLVRRTVETVLASAARPVVVVTGHQAEEVRAELKGLDVKFVHNPSFNDGLSGSLKAGIGGLPPDIEGAVICLGDMPAIKPGHIDALLAAFNPIGGKAIGVPVHTGKRGNPVLWARRFFDEMKAVSGDVGARHLIGANESLVYEVVFEDTAVLTDLDTPQQWADYLSGRRRPDGA